MATRPRDTETDSMEYREARREAGRIGGLLDGVRRLAPAVIGGALLAVALRRRSAAGWVIGLVGGWILVRTYRNRGRAAETGISTTDEPGATDRKPAVAVDERGAAGGPTVSRSVVVDRPAGELYELWRDPDEFTRIVGRVADVSSAGEDRYHWSVAGPLGRELEWETRVVEGEPGERLGWATTGDAPVPHAGSVRFRPAPGDRGTEVTLTVSVDPPGGGVGDAALDRLAPVTGTVLGEALGRFKSLAESGEVPTLEGNPSGRGSGDLI